MKPKVEKTEEAWKSELSPDVFTIARKKGTEPAFTGVYWDCHDEGTYRCACCDAPLFASAAKFDSGSGWPSFSAPLDEENVATEEDHTHGMTRTEATCRQCGAHLGHVFDDGPRAAGGLRYCINSASLKLEKK